MILKKKLSIENIIQHSTTRWQESDSIVWSKNKENSDERSCGAAREYYGSSTYDGPVTSFKINHESYVRVSHTLPFLDLPDTYFRGNCFPHCLLYVSSLSTVLTKLRH
jgi:hypothetical protein